MVAVAVYNQIITDDDACAVYEVVKSGYVTQAGSSVQELEKIFSKKYQRYALACSNGTTALHLSLLAFNLQGATIAVPLGAYAAVGFAASYMKCNIEFIDIEETTWNIDLNKLEKTCKNVKIDAVIAVHNYGNPYDYNRLRELSYKYKFYIIEDACEALGSKMNGKLAGQMGDVSVFSFYGNKMITGGEGGMVLIDDKEIANRIKLLRSQAVNTSSKFLDKRFLHQEVGYNYRITNMQAALILSQYKRLESNVERCKEIHEVYLKSLPRRFKFQAVLDDADPCWWMTSILCPTKGHGRISKMLSFDIATRPIFPPMTRMKPWFNNSFKKTVANQVFECGITLPSGPGLTDDQIYMVCKALSTIS